MYIMKKHNKTVKLSIKRGFRDFLADKRNIHKKRLKFHFPQLESEKNMIKSELKGTNIMNVIFSTTNHS